MPRGKRTKKTSRKKTSVRLLLPYLVLILIILISYVAVIRSRFTLSNKAAESGDCSLFVSEKKAPLNEASLNSRTVTFIFTDNGKCNYPHDAYVAIYDQSGRPLDDAQSGWLSRVIGRAGLTARWTYVFEEDGRYSWLVRTKDSKGIMSNRDENKLTLNIDSTSPTKPEKCRTHPSYNQYHFTISWDPSFENGLSLRKGQVIYQVEAAYDSGFADICASSWRSGLDYNLGDKCWIDIGRQGHVAYVRVRARDTFGNFSPYAYCTWGHPL